MCAGKAGPRSRSGSRKGPNGHYLHSGPAHALAQASQTHAPTTGTFTKGLVHARPWTGQLNLNVNVTNLEDTRVLPPIRPNFCGNGNLEVGQVYLSSFQDFQSLQIVQALHTGLLYKLL